MTKLTRTLAAILLALVLYLALWPVPIDPVAWSPPADTTNTGPYARNERLDPIEALSLAGHVGPEDLAVDVDGRIYAATEHGVIVRLDADGKNPTAFADTGGRPLGIAFDPAGNLMVADAFRGLLEIDVAGAVTVLADDADGKPILYADDVDVAADGKVYFSDASTKFGAKQWGGTMAASRLEIIEHRCTGRLLEYDPATRRARTLLGDLCFANGVAVAHDGSFVLVNDTAEYKVVRHHLSGPKAGERDLFAEALPGFPDNLSRGLDGTYWLALVTPRIPIVDRAAGSPFLRRLVMRLPQALQPQAVPFIHLVAFDGDGRLLDDLQRPRADHIVTSVTETREHLYLGSLTSPMLQRWKKRGLAPRPGAAASALAE